VAQRQIPNLTPVVFISPTAQLEIVQDGTTYRASAAQIAALGSQNATFKLVNDITDAAKQFPLFAKTLNGSADTLYTSDPKYNYLAIDGLLSAQRIDATEGIVYNNSAASLDYTFPTGDNGSSVGPITLNAVITVPTGSEWAII
jgi:hypothetical protein